MGRGASVHKCCDRQKLTRGLWSPDEDARLIGHIDKHGAGCWSRVPKLAGLQRCGKSCRLRWFNYLRPDLKRGMITADEERLIIKLRALHGNSWSRIRAHLPGRTDIEIKNFCNSLAKSKNLQSRKEQQRGISDNNEITKDINRNQIASPIFPFSYYNTNDIGTFNDDSSVPLPAAYCEHKTKSWISSIECSYKAGAAPIHALNYPPAIFLDQDHSNIPERSSKVLNLLQQSTQLTAEGEVEGLRAMLLSSGYGYNDHEVNEATAYDYIKQNNISANIAENDQTSWLSTSTDIQYAGVYSYHYLAHNGISTMNSDCNLPYSGARTTISSNSSQYSYMLADVENVYEYNNTIDSTNSIYSLSSL